MKVTPINFNLMSELEQKAVLEQYKIFLKGLSSKIQIIISSRKTDVKNHLKKVFEVTNENSQISDMGEDYIRLVHNLIDSKNAVKRDYYMVLEDNNNIQNDINKIKECMQKMGNNISECSKEEIIILLRNHLNRRQENLR